jgi:16S rRNA (guanine527-N7)-methyltransferase
MENTTLHPEQPITETVDVIFKYFTGLTARQKEQFSALSELYHFWNERINVISRKDIDNIYSRHILHSLSIGKFISPISDTKFLDFGCGGGFPGIPLAILWPDCHFHLIDRVGKKIRVATEVANSIDLKNITFQHGDAGECHDKFDYVVSRAVMRLEALAPLAKRNISSIQQNKLHNGLICLKGGDLASEVEATGGDTLEIPLTDYFSEPFFETKKLIYKPL